jgi:MFS family permease
MAVASLNPFRTLQRHRNFRLFWFGQTLSLVGSWMQSMAQGWLALELSNSAFVVGLVAAVGSLPILLFTLQAGVIVDRVPKLRLVKLMQSLLLVEATLLWWFTWSGHITIPWLLVLAAASGFCGAFEIPARQSLIVNLVAREDLQGAIALNSSGFNLARIVGPALAAVVIANFGLAWCFGLNALSYLAVLVGLAMIRLPEGVDVPVAATTSRLSGFMEGLRYMRHTRPVFELMKLVGVYAVLGAPYLTLMPVVARDKLGIGAGGYGVLLSCVGAGGVAGALVLAGVGANVRRGRALLASGYGYCVLLVAFAFARSEFGAGIVLFMTGFMMIVTNALANGLLQTLVPDAFRGRLMAAYSFTVVGLAQVVGAFAGGAIARAIGVDFAIGICAALMLAYTLLARTRFPELVEL